MDIVIIDDNGKKLCIDTSAPQHRRVKAAIETHAAEINRLIESSMLEIRIKDAKKNIGHTTLAEQKALETEE